jgi:hypothetical protein
VAEPTSSNTTTKTKIPPFAAILCFVMGMTSCLGPMAAINFNLQAACDRMPLMGCADGSRPECHIATDRGRTGTRAVCPGRQISTAPLYFAETLATGVGLLLTIAITTFLVKRANRRPAS